MSLSRKPGLTALLARDPAAVRWRAAGAWNDLAAEAVHYGLAPLVHRRLQDAGASPPCDVVRILRDRYLASAAANMRLFHELAAILRAMDGAGIPAIPLKGASLAAIVYGDIALRPMGDIDILVRPADMQAAVGTLRGLGYGSAYAFDPASEESISHHMPPMSADGRAPVELHWTLVHPRAAARIGRSEIEDAWSRAVPAAIDGVPARMLAPEDQLLHLCMHASVHHQFGVGLRAFVDIAEACRRFEQELDWTQVTRRANRWGVANGVRMALTLAQEWTELAVPASVQAGLNGAQADEDSLDWARHKVLDGGPAALKSDFARLETETSAVGRLMLLRDAFFPSRAVMARRYGVPGDSRRILFFYPHRLWDLWGRYRGALWKLLTRDKTLVAEIHHEARLRAYLGAN